MDVQTSASTSTSSNPMGLVIGLVFYLIYGFWIMSLSTKLGEPDGWWGFIPILNYLQIARCAGKQMIMGLLYIIPCIGWIFLLIDFWKIAERRNKSGFYGILLFIPIINFIAMFLILQD